MGLKPRYKRRIFWTAVSLFGAGVLAVVFIPPMITLNSMKSRLEAAIAQQTGISAKINGDVHFSLLGRATIVAHDVSIPDGTIHSAMFAIPMHDIFDLENATISDHITIYGARLQIQELTPLGFGNDLSVNSSTVRFMDKDYEIIRGRIINGQFTGLVRTDQHKYEIEFENDEFFIRNQNDNLEIIGQLYSDGTARGELSIDTDDVNKWFEFSEPKINRPVAMTMNFVWDGGYGFDFTNIRADNFWGDIKLYPDGRKDIKLYSDDMEYDFTFLLNPNRIYYETKFDLDFHGKLKFVKREFEHLKINAVGTREKLQIGTIVADDIAIVGGTIDTDGAHDVMITMPMDGVRTMCLFSGTPEKWKCADFAYGDMSGSLSVDGDTFNLFVQSDSDMPDIAILRAQAARLGHRGVINFQFRDAAGTIELTDKDVKPKFTFAKNKTLSWIGLDLPFLPEFMTNAIGDFEWNGDTLAFKPYDGEWTLTTTDGDFYISGNNFKSWLPGIDLQSLNDLKYIVSGKYRRGAISNLEIKIAGHVFTGSAVGKSITLKTSVLDLDVFTNQNYIDNYDELEFLTMHPIMLPFEIPVDISLSTEKLIYSGDEYQNFVYALKRGTQTFSIADGARGNLLATITKNKNQYDIFAQLNRFKITGALLNSDMPLNVRDTLITAELDMHTSGQIAHDIAYNMSGNMDMTFEGGYITGLGLDDFYASAENIMTLNVEYALSAALDDGETQIKKMRIVGRYADGDFATTEPITLSVRHADATGALQIADGNMAAQLYIVMRGTAPTPAPIDFEITGNSRNYSLSEIMRNFDPGFLRNFVKTHNRF